MNLVQRPIGLLEGIVPAGEDHCLVARLKRRTWPKCGKMRADHRPAKQIAGMDGIELRPQAFVPVIPESRRIFTGVLKDELRALHNSRQLRGMVSLFEMHLESDLTEPQSANN